MVILFQYILSFSESEIAFFCLPKVRRSFRRNAVCPYHLVSATGEWKCCGCVPGCKNDQSDEAWSIHRHCKYFAYLWNLCIIWNSASPFRTVVLIGGDFAPRGMLGNVWRPFLVVTAGNGVKWVEPRDAGKRPATPKRAPHNKELAGPRVQRAEVEKLCFLKCRILWL